MLALSFPLEEAHVNPGSGLRSLALPNVSRLESHQLLWGSLMATLARITCLIESYLASVVQHQLSLTSRLRLFTPF